MASREHQRMIVVGEAALREAEVAWHAAVEGLQTATRRLEQVEAAKRPRRLPPEPEVFVRRVRYGPGVSFSEVATPAPSRPVFTGAPGVSGTSSATLEPSAMSPAQARRGYDLARQQAVEASQRLAMLCQRLERPCPDLSLPEPVPDEER